jgi:DNA (cytosine-5)-methyltransferase 1
MTYYNEHDPKAAAWLRELIKAGEIPPGEVDERSIVDVRGDDLAAFAQCHFFAGIGGWAYALRLADWPDDRPVWTGSCPCQPFSAAGKGLGAADSRHLWPEFARLIGLSGPAIVFGEQVASADGREWLAGVRTDLEALGYAVGAADLCAAGVSAPHLRQRLFFVAHSNGRDTGTKWEQRSWQQRQQSKNGGHFETLGLPASESLRRCRQPWESAVAIECEDGPRRIAPGILALADGLPGRLGLLRGYGNAIVPLLAAEFIRASEEALKN